MDGMSVERRAESRETLKFLLPITLPLWYLGQPLGCREGPSSVQELMLEGCLTSQMFRVWNLTLCSFLKPNRNLPLGGMV